MRREPSWLNRADGGERSARFWRAMLRRWNFAQVVAKTESVYRRYAIVSEGDLGDGIEKLRELATGTKTGTKGRSGQVKRFRRSS